MKYLNPKADMTFKRVFGEHPAIVMSFLNALLPLADDEQIESIEYLPAEMVPDTPLKKNSIVDVRCRDQKGRQFIVEMQMIWTSEFKQRVLFNASKAYVRQLDHSENYHLLQPVYSLNLINDIFEPELPDYYHSYRMVHEMHTDKIIEGLHLVFIELPKFNPTAYIGKRMQVLWLRYLTEIDERTKDVDPELLSDENISKALATIEESAYNEAQMAGYDKFWDNVRVEKTLFDAAERRGLASGIAKGMAEGMKKGMAEGMEKGMAEGMKKGMAEGIEKGMAEGMEKGMEKGMAEGMEKGMAKGLEKGVAKGILETKIDTARKMKELGIDKNTIKAVTGLSEDQLANLA